MKNMGCIPSNTTQISQYPETGMNPDKMLQNSDTVVQAYVRLDDMINDIEKDSPGPQLANLVPVMQNIQEEAMKFDEMISKNATHLHDDPLTQVLIDLKLSQFPHLAVEHEEFVANINRQEITRFTKSLVETKFDSLKAAKTKLESDVNRLQLLYKEQDLLMERVLGTQYGNMTEKSLEADLTRARALRDTLAVGAKAWRLAGGAAVKAHSFASTAVLSWQLIPQSREIPERVKLGIDARNNLIAGVHEIQSAQSALPAAPFPHCTPRQLQALILTLDYMFTDMYSNERYKHATRVFSGFSERTMALATWITDVLKKSLDKDLYGVEEDVNRIVNELRTIRVNLIVEKGYADVLYKPPKDLNNL